MGHYDEEALNTQAGVKGYTVNRFESSRMVTKSLGRTDAELFEWGYTIAADVDGVRYGWLWEPAFWTFVKNRHLHKKTIRNIKRTKDDESRNK